MFFEITYIFLGRMIILHKEGVARKQTHEKTAYLSLSKEL
jgi:hypothetical protein